jgi:hypothetical protein
MAVVTVKRSELAKRERPQLNVLVSSEMKDLISEMATNSGQSMGQVVERLLDRAITYDKMLDTMKQSMAEIRRGSIEAAFRAEGYTPVRSPYGTIWVPKEYPIERSRFLAQHEVEKIEREREERGKGEPK